MPDILIKNLTSDRAELISVLTELMRYAPGEYIKDIRTDLEIDKGNERAFIAAKDTLKKIQENNHAL